MKALILFGLILVVAGCKTSRPDSGIYVANLTGKSIKSIRVSGDAGLSIKFSRMDGTATEKYYSIESDLGREVSIVVEDEAGMGTTNKLTLRQFVGKEFEGRVFFQVEQPDKVTVFLERDKKGKRIDDTSATERE